MLTFSNGDAKILTTGKVKVRGLGMLKADQQLENLIDWLSKMQGALPEAVPA
jgi:transcription-repair coupling factor (superfamily II helicase)